MDSQGYVERPYLPYTRKQAAARSVKYMAKLANDPGLERAAGGVPVQSSQAMKKFVWSEARVKGGQPFGGTVPKPMSTTEPLQ